MCPHPRLPFAPVPPVPVHQNTGGGNEGEESTSSGTRPPADPEGGRDTIPDRETFEALSRRDDVPGALGVREVKLLIEGIGAEPKLWFMDTNRYAYHYDFAFGALDVSMELGEFNRQTYFTDARRFLAGSLLAHDSFHGENGEQGLYTLEFWPTDPVSLEHVELAWNLVLRGMPLLAGQLAFHPAGQSQQDIVAANPTYLPSAGVRVIETQTLFAQVRYSPLNLGEGYGVLRVVDASDRRPPTVRDVVIFKSIPNDLSHVAGVLTEQPQTPLSHINLKAKQNDTPNAYLRDAASDRRIVPLLGKEVFFAVRPDDIELREASAAEVQEHLESIRPAQPQTPQRDLARKEIEPLDRIGHHDFIAFGAKAANLGELRKALPETMVPDGFAVPFSFYDDFMRETGLYDRARETIASEGFASDPVVREDALKKLRKAIKKADVPEHLADALHAMHQAFPAGTNPRCRSSTNNEDLEGFNGAGLYDSYTHRPDEGHIVKSIKQVWASLWNFRAYEEREFYRIDHFASAMGVLVHPNFDDERVNGVAVTKNIYDPAWPGFYVNVQVGEALVTNPDPGATPDEVLIQILPPDDTVEIQYIRRSSLVEAGATVMTREQLELLVQQLQTIDRHFVPLYGRQGDRSFAMDVEFKIDADGVMVIKQARPWVD